MIAVTQENSSVNQQAILVGEVLDLQHLLQENQTLRCERNYYKSLLERAIAREELLKQEIQQLIPRSRVMHPDGRRKYDAAMTNKGDNEYGLNDYLP